MAIRLDGRAAANELEAEAAERCRRYLATTGRPPGLEVILVGEDPASTTYVRSKEKAAERVGIRARTHRLPDTTGTDELLERVERLNDDDAVDAVLVQLPLPDEVDTRRVLDAVDWRKDVDGFHPTNAGLLLQGRAHLVSCTPAGIMRLLRRHDVPLEGRRAVVIGRSLIVGKPMALLLMQSNATVTVCHSRTRDLPAHTREAEVLVVAAGRPGMITAEHVREGATVIDVGIHRLSDPELARRLWGDSERWARFEERGWILVGDVDFRGVEPVAGAITPVPGGVGPMTVTHLLLNTLRAAEARAGIQGSP